MEIAFSKLNIIHKTNVTTYCYLLSVNDKKILLIMSPQGMGLIRKGGIRRYVDSVIWQNIFNPIFKKYCRSLKYKPKIIENKYFDISSHPYQNEMILLELELDIPKIGKIKWKSKDLNIMFSKIKSFLKLKDLFDLGEITKVKVKSSYMKRVVEIRRNGVIRVNEKNELKVISYIYNILTAPGDAHEKI